MADRWVTTHPFIAFHLDGRRINPRTWALLGECSSKIQHVSGVPLRPDTAAAINQIFLAKGAHATTAIEGNTLSEEEVSERMEGRLALPKSREYLGREVDNILTAYNLLVDRTVTGAHPHVSTEEIGLLNHLTLQGLDLDPGVEPGTYRKHSVAVGDYKAPPADQVPELMERFCSWMNNPVWERDMGVPFVLPILKAIVGHLYFAWIHPFGDGNGRTARLLEFDILTRAGVPTASAHLLSDYYNRTRTRYYRALSRAREDAVGFVEYAVQGFADGLREQLVTIREQQMSVTWMNYVFQKFRHLPHTEAYERRREVAIALSFALEPVLIDEIPELSSRLAELYGARHERTLVRDIEALADMRLVAQLPTGELIANTDLVTAFLPLARRAGAEPVAVPVQAPETGDPDQEEFPFG